MKGKDKPQMAVFRSFRRMLYGALFALAVVFTMNDAVALSRNCSAGQYAYLSTQCKTCPANCYCPTNGSKQGTGWTSIECTPYGIIRSTQVNSEITNGSFDLNTCYQKNNLFPNSDAGSDSASDCYAMLAFDDSGYAYLSGIDSTVSVQNISSNSYAVKKCYNNNSGNATTCTIPKSPQSPGISGSGWTDYSVFHLTGEWCYERSGSKLKLEVVSSNSNFVTVRMPSETDTYTYLADDIERKYTKISPCFAENIITILFDTNGATGSPSETSKSCACSDCSTASVGSMVKTGYKFVCWNTKADGTGRSYLGKTVYQGSTRVSCVDHGHGETVTLYAIWEPREYWIYIVSDNQLLMYLYTRYDNGVYTDSERTMAMTASSNPITVPTKDGYTFQGYYSVNGSGGTQYVTSNGYITSAGLSAAKGYVSNNNEWYAHWVPNNYTISLNKSGGGNGTTTLYTKYNTGVYTDSARTNAMSTYSNSITVPIKTGYTFQGYYSTSGGGTQYVTSNGFITSSGLSAAKGYMSSQTWYARWTPNNYTISLDRGGVYNGTTTLYTTYGTGVYTDSSRTTAMSISANPITTPTKNRWTFQGYYSTSGSGGTLYISSNGYITSAGLSAAKGTNSNQTWYARWTYDGDTVNLYSNCPGGSNALVATVGVWQNESMPYRDLDGDYLVRPTCTGYAFRGYYDAQSGGTQYYNNSPSSVRNWDKSTGGNLYAHWEQIGSDFTATFDGACSDTARICITAAGKFHISWGNDKITVIDKPNTTRTCYDSEDGDDYYGRQLYDINIYRTESDGLPKGYSANEQVIHFDDRDCYKSIDGSIGSVFPTLSSVSVNGASTQPLFEDVFAEFGITSVSEGLFDGISGTPVPNMFNSTFEDCDNLTTINGQLFPTFDNNSISNSDNMFYETFVSCDELRTIPGNLFAGIKGQPAQYMFAHTFEDCSLLENVPQGLFSSLSGVPQEGCFYETFYNTNVTRVPADLFGGFSGNLNNLNSDNAFYDTFYNTPLKTFRYYDGRTEYSDAPWISPEFFGNLNGAGYTSGPMEDVFYGTDVETDCSKYPGYEQYITGFESDFDGHVSCIKQASCASDKMHYNGTCIDPKFTLTTTNMSAGNEFGFHVTASGIWVVDWGGGTTQAIIRDGYSDSIDDDYDLYSHTYTSGGVHVIKMTGLATDYSGNDDVPAITFGQSGTEDYIASISGSLGAMFPSLAGNNNPSFNGLFNDADYFTGEIPSTLFSGVTGCRDYMFQGSFSYGGFTRIPSGLFSNITDIACMNMFYETFYNCDNLTTIESGAFPRIDGCGDYSFAYTFQDSENLVNIPADLFKNQTGGCQGMFAYTFDNTGLTSIPPGLFSDINSTGAEMFQGTFANTQITEVPRGLFDSIENSETSLFANTFDGCQSLTTVPDNLFSGFDDVTPDNNSFAWMFGGTALQYFKDANGNTVDYIPPTFFAGLDNSGYQSGPLSSIFDGTNIRTSCPANTYRYITGFEVDFDDKVSCASCPTAYFHSADNNITDITGCYATVAFDANGGSVVPSQNVNYTANTSSGYTLTPPTSTKTGYTLEGWHQKSNLSDIAITSSTTMSGDKTLYAKWTPIESTIDYNLNGGQVDIDEENTMCEYDSEFILPSAPTKPGYNFIGWILQQ